MMISLPALAHAAAALAATLNGFPPDFPPLVASGGPAAGQSLSGWGGLPRQNAAAQRAALHHRPVILLHGNGANANDPTWGMVPLHDDLIRAGYNDAEIWTLSYLGAANVLADMPTPYTNNIDDVRRFIDQVRSYLGVERVDLIAHSLGAGLAKGYLDGLESDGSYRPADEGYAHVGTLVSLGGAHYGLGPFSVGEFLTGGAFESASHAVDGVLDDTPHGASEEAAQRGEYQGVSPLDDDQVTYVALWCIDDFVDAQNPETGRLVGAELNQGLALGYGLEGHAALIKAREVFALFQPYLNRP